MALSETRLWSSVFTTTLDDVKDQIADQVHEHIVFTWFMRNKGRGRDTGGGRGVRFQNGGARIRVPVVLAKNNNTKWYSRYEGLTVNPTDEITNGIDDMKMLSQTIGISGEELDQNRGDAAKFDLLREKVDIAQMSMAEKLEQSLVAGALQVAATPLYFIPDTSSKATNPLGLLIQKDPTQSVTIHSLNQNTEVDWRNKTALSAAGTTTFAGYLREMSNLYNQCSLGNTNDAPDLILADQFYYEVYEAALVAKQQYNYGRYETDAEPSAGFRGLIYKGATLHFSTFVPDFGTTAADAVDLTPANTSCGAFFINTRWMELVVSSRVNFSISPFEVPIDQDSMWAKILWRGQLVCNQRRKQGLHYSVGNLVA